MLNNSYCGSNAYELCSQHKGATFTTPYENDHVRANEKIRLKYGTNIEKSCTTYSGKASDAKSRQK